MAHTSMTHRFCIEDEAHSELQSEHETFEAAIAELERLARLPWDAEPNQAPCTSWRTCGRRYEIVEYDISTKPWGMLRKVPALKVGPKGVAWDAALPRECGA
jgi:hypothetical protein